MDECYGRDAHATRDANAHVESGFVSLAVGSLVSSPVEAEQKKAARFVNEATGPTDAGWNSVANPPTGLGTERVREEVEGEEAQATSETLSKQRRGKREAKAPH
jgi:hypothetical protein